MSAYQSFTTARSTEADFSSLLAQLRALDATAGIQHVIGTPVYVVKKATPWTAAQIASAQTVIDTAPPATPQLSAQAAIDVLGLVEKAITLTILDQFNFVRSKLVPPLPPITVDQMLAAVRAKAGTL